MVLEILNEKMKIGYSLYLYAFILLTHILLSIVLIPMVLTSYVRAIQKEFDPHKKIAKYDISCLAICYNYWSNCVYNDLSLLLNDNER